MTRDDTAWRSALRRFLRAPLGCSIVLTIGITCLLAATADAAGGLDEALRLYQESEYVRAKQEAAKHLDEPLGKLVFHLCQVHDAKHRALKPGLAGLRSLYDDDALGRRHPAVWAEAALGYARVIQLFQIRKMHPEYDDVDPAAVYRDVLKTVPKDRRACTAAIYLAEGYFRSDARETHDAGFRLVEDFLTGYAGDVRNTVPVHVYVEGYYINLRRDYAKSYTHLLRAYDLGITKQMLKRETLFRMGRMCQVKLTRPGRARRHYLAFLRLYPEAERTPAVRRYLAELPSGTPSPVGTRGDGGDSK